MIASLSLSFYIYIYQKVAPKRWRLEINFTQDAVLMLSSMTLHNGIQVIIMGLNISYVYACSFGNHESNYSIMCIHAHLVIRRISISNIFFKSLS